MIKLIDLSNNVVDANQILAMGVNSNRTNGPTNRVKITFKARKEYVYNPNIECFELEDFKDVLYVDFPEYETAKAHLNGWMEEWQDALILE